MKGARLEQAIYNNAVWCDAVCRAHGSPGTFYEDIWINRSPTPRSYPNAVTLTRGRRETDHTAHIHELIAAGIAGEWGIKDSFRSLALASLGQPQITRRPIAHSLALASGLVTRR